MDPLPYGQPVTSADLMHTDLVIALPVIDLVGQDGELTLNYEAWNEEEIDVLEQSVAGGGLLVLTNSDHRLAYTNRVGDLNKAWRDVSAVAERLGIRYQDGTLPEPLAWTASGSHPLVEGTSYLEMITDNGHPFTVSDTSKGQDLARAGGESVIRLVEHGDAGGQVLALADVGLLGNDGGAPQNLRFWQNLALYARSR